MVTKKYAAWLKSQIAICSHRIDDLRNLNGVEFVDDDESSAPEKAIVDKKIDVVAHVFIKLDDRSLRKKHHIFDIHLRAAELDDKPDVHIKQQRKVLLALIAAHLFVTRCAEVHRFNRLGGGRRRAEEVGDRIQLILIKAGIRWRGSRSAAEQILRQGVKLRGACLLAIGSEKLIKILQTEIGFLCHTFLYRQIAAAENEKSQSPMMPSLARFFLPPLRRVVFFLRKTVPAFFAAGGAIHDRADYPLTLAALRPAVRAIFHNRRSDHRVLYWLQACRWIRLSARLAAHSVELRLEPVSWPGRLLLKLFSYQAARSLRRLHARIYEAAYQQAPQAEDQGSGFEFAGSMAHYSRPAPINRFAALLQTLYRFRWLPVERLRLSSVFFIALKPTLPDIPPFHSGGAGWLLSAELFAITAKKGLRIPRLLSRRLQSLLWQMHPVMLIRNEDGRHLHGYLISEQRGHAVRPAGPFYYLPLEAGISGLALRPGRYGGFDRAFPFRNTDDPTFLFYERSDGLIDCYQVLCEYPANHLQRFSVRPLYTTMQRQKRPFVETLQSVVRPLPVDGALYLSRIDLHLKAFFRLRRSDCLWRPALDPVPALDRVQALDSMPTDMRPGT